MHLLEQSEISEHNAPVNRGFSIQSVNYDEVDRSNRILQDMRQQVYKHVSHYLKPKTTLLELNAGTGIDALHFAQQGHSVHATDLSDGMVREMERKIRNHPLEGRFTCKQLSFERLDALIGRKFDHVISNFGGLNCVDDLTKVTEHLPKLLNPGGYVTFVIMPKVCLWELLVFFKGRVLQAFRRFKPGGVLAHVEGEYFMTYYHSLRQIKKAFGSSFEFIQAEGLAALSPPPHRKDFPVKYPKLYTILRHTDGRVRHRFPFNRWADHIIVTFQLH